jgi:hypothetical protein
MVDQLKISRNRINRLKQRIIRNGSILPRNRGRKRVVTDELVNWLTTWFEMDENVGKGFKSAYLAMIDHFGKDYVKVTRHGCYKAFKKYSNHTWKRIQRIKIRSNTEKNKRKRMEYLLRFLPYHNAEAEGEVEIIFIDEAGFNLDK